MIHWLNRIGNTYGGVLAISGILLSIFLYLIPNISLPSWLKLLLVIVMLVSFHKLFVILRDFILSRSKPSITQGRIFRGIFIHNGGTPADGPSLFDRSQEIEELEKAILHEDGKDHILAVTGVSGIGKSILVEMIVDKLKKQNTNLSKITLARFNNPEKSDLSIINDTISFVRQHKDILTQSIINNSNPYVVIVLDQFEVCLDHILDVYLNCQKSSKSLRDYLADGTNHSDIIVRDLCTLILFKKEFDRLRIIVVLRSDRYYDLRILGEYGQIPYNAFEVLGGCQVFS